MSRRAKRTGPALMRGAVGLLIGGLLLGACSAAPSSAPSASAPESAPTAAAATESASTPAPTSAPTAAPSPTNALNALLPQRVRDRGFLLLGTDAEYPPCEYYDEAGNMVGFEPDLWDAVAAKLGIGVKPESISFDGLLPGVESGRFDVAIECITDRPDREEHYTFVDFYYGAGGIVTTVANPKGISDDPLSMCGLTAGAQTGTDFIMQANEIFSPHCVKNGKDPIVIKEYPSEGQVLLALQSDRVDFVLADLAAGAYLIKQSGGKLQIFGNPLAPKVNQGFVTRPDDTELQQALLKAIQAIQADGTYDSIMQKWGIEFLSQKEPGINLTTTRPTETPAP